ncbi:MAG: hypothetical protein JWM36_2648 [Hyphomicrobiales bacterium]|nr:hypothetical protein [Hyphomicrobiales bacterium]
MSSTPDSEAFQDADFETIEAAVNETARGRWFLAEFARRNRAAETDRLHASLHRIESTVAVPQDRPSFDVAQFHAMAQELARRLDEVTAHLRTRPLPIPPDTEMLRIEHGGEPEPSERRLIEQRMIEPKPFFVRREEAGAGTSTEPLSPAHVVHSQIGRLSERLESMRRAGPPSASEPPVESNPAETPSLADIEAMPLMEKLRFFA